MKTLSNHDVDHLLEDISSIKQVINKNRPLLRQIINLARFRWFLLSVSLAVIGISTAVFFLMQHYGSFSAIPNPIKITIYVTIGISAVILQIWKGKAYTASIKLIDPDMTLCKTFKMFYSSQISLLYLTFVILLFFFSAYFIVKGIPFYIIPLSAIITGLITLSFGVLLHMRQVYFISYYQLITGLLIIVFPAIPVPWAISITLGISMLFLAVNGFLANRSQSEA